MTKLLEQGIAAVRTLAQDRQDTAGELLLALAGHSPGKSSLTQAQIEDLRLAIAEADRGEFATEAEIAELWRKCGA